MCIHGLTEAEAARLTVVREELDKVEMLKMAPAFERLESELSAVREVRDEVLRLLAEVGA